jgi:hypothetical protein
MGRSRFRLYVSTARDASDKQRMNSMSLNESSPRTELASTATVSSIRRCKDCRHYRMRAKPEPFSASELQTAGGLKARIEWQQQEKQHAEREAQLVGAGAPFTYEPHHYAWCAYYTDLELVRAANAGDAEAIEQLMHTSSAVLDPVSGEFTPIYALCRRMNPEGACEHHERS